MVDSEEARLEARRAYQREYRARNREKANARSRAWYAAHRAQHRDAVMRGRTRQREWWRQFKRTLQCARCPENHPTCLDFHHTDPAAKEFTLSRVAFVSRERLEVELAKCIVLCANCHRKEHDRLKADA